jgi:hypothetical protein
MNARSTIVGLSVLTATFAAASVADAQVYWRDDQNANYKRQKDSIVAVEIRFGPYKPNVDDGVGKVPCSTAGCTPAGPYDTVFGDSNRIMIGLEVDWQIIHIARAVSLGVGGLIGYTKSSGTAQFKDGSGGSIEEADLSIIPMAALGVARIEGIALNAGIPIVPYAKLGPAIGFWSSSNGRGISYGRTDGKEGRGHTAGVMYALGLSLMLDFLDPQAAKSFAVERGVQHTYAFFEYTVTNLTGLGQTGAMYLGDKTWNVGLMFEM